MGCPNARQCAMSTERLDELERKCKRQKRHGTQLLWVKYNPSAEYRYDLVDAREDIEWMIAEIRRLREENASLREGLDALREQLRTEIDSSAQSSSGSNRSKT